MRWVAVLVLVGCGRIAFDPGGFGDAGDAVAVDACTFGPWGTATEINAASTSVDDYGPTLSADNLTLYFHSGAVARDIYISTRASELAPFGAPQLIPALANPAHDQGPTLSPDELTLYFGSDRGGAMRLYRSTRATTTAPFGAPTLVPELANEDCWGPELSADGSELFYTHTNTTTQEVWRATYSEATGFVVQGHVGELDGPNLFDGFATLSGDGTTIYWERAVSSAGPSEIDMATRTAPGAPFTAATPVSFNRPGTNSDPDISRDGRFFVFAATGSVGGMDLMIVQRDCI